MKYRQTNNEHMASVYEASANAAGYWARKARNKDEARAWRAEQRRCEQAAAHCREDA